MKPMEGVKVVEFSTMITASFAAMMLAEQGASVVKVEPIELGDPMRYLGSSKGGISALFANCNRGKESVRINMKDAQGAELVRKLVSEADIVVCNYRPGVMDELGLGSEALREQNPRLIYAGVSGFGTEGPLRDAPAYDPIIQAISGVAAVQGKGQPEMVRNLTCDKVTAYTTCQAVTAALYQREKTGLGQHIDISMLDANLFFIFPDGFMHHTLLDEDVEPQPPLSDMLYELTVTKDGAITTSAATEQQRVGLLLAVDKLDLMADERFNSQDKLIANFVEFKTLVGEAFQEFTTEEILKRLKENDVPAAKCFTHQEVLAQQQLADNHSMEFVEHPVMGNMRLVRSPVRFGGDQLEHSRLSPAHGEHTRTVLKRLGHTDADIDAMEEAGVLRA